jgi:hypothetical protein
VNRDEELQALRRPFAIGVAGVLVVVAAIGVIIALFGSSADRPAGIAERWLVAVGDTTKDGIEEDARDRAAENGLTADVAEVLAPDLVTDVAVEDRERAFDSVQVGAAAVSGSGVRVPFRVAQYEGEDVDGYVFLLDGTAGWEVVALQEAGDGIWLGGDDALAAGFRPGPDRVVIERPERAPIGWFAGALALGVLSTLGCVAAVRAATPKPR